MTVGNIVSVTIQLYRARFGNYLALSGQAVLWFVIPLVLFAIAVGFLAASGFDNLEQGGTPNGSLVGLGVLMIVTAFVSLVYCGVRSMVCGGTISRLAFLDLIENPEPVKDAKRFVRRRMWKLFFAAFLVSLIITSVYSIVAIVIFVLFGIGGALVAVALGPSLNTASTETTMLIGLISLLVMLVFILIISLVFSWVFARLFVYETPIVVEEKVAAVDTIGISWQLTKGNGFRVLTVLMIAVVVTIPLAVVTQVVSMITQPLLMLALPLPETVNFVLGTIVGIGIGLLGNLLILPLWQILKSIVYYDLKSRKEGIDLQLS